MKQVVISENTPEVSTGYTPRPLQLRLHKALKRFNVIVCHRRFGKTIFSINHMIDRALRCQLPMPRFAYLAPTYGQAKRIVWDQLKNYTYKIAEPHEADLRVDIHGNKGRIMLLSAENPMSLKGIYLDGVLLDEYAEMNPAVWREVIRPTLSDRKGWAAFIGTPKGQNNFYDLYEYARTGEDAEWYSTLYKASETGIISKEELESARRTMTEEEYMQEYECSFTAGLVGAYFGKELAKAEEEKRIGIVPHDPMIPVDTYWDLGINDTTAIWFVQTVHGSHRFIDYYEVCGAGLPDIIAEIHKKHYKFGSFVLPHDAAARDLSTGRSRQQMFYSLGCRHTRIIPRVGTKMESINAARVMFSRCYFDAERCKIGLKALAQYQRRWDAKNNVFMDSPLHNWASNCADAFQQFALGCRDVLGDSRGGGVDNRNGPGIMAEVAYDPYAVLEA